MKPKTLKRKLANLGLENQSDAAEAIYGERNRQPNISRWLSGTHPIPRWVERSVELLEQTRGTGGPPP